MAGNLVVVDVWDSLATMPSDSRRVGALDGRAMWLWARIGQGSLVAAGTYEISTIVGSYEINCGDHIFSCIFYFF